MEEKYEEEAKSKFNLLLQVQEQQRNIQEQRRIIENLRSKVSELEIAQKQPIMTEAKSENTVNNGKTLFGTKASVDSGLSGGDSALIRPATHRVISIDTSGLDVTKSSFSPENRSAPVSPAVTSSRSRRNSWQVKSSSLRYSPKTVGTLEKADPLSPNLKAANLEFGRRKSFTVFTHSEWLKAQRLQKTSLSSDRTIRRISQGGSGVPVALVNRNTGTRRKFIGEGIKQRNVVYKSHHKKTVHDNG